MEPITPFYILLPFFVCVLGALAWAWATNPKATEMGKICFGHGLLITLFVLATHVVRL